MPQQWIQKWILWTDLSSLSPLPLPTFKKRFCLAFSGTPLPGVVNELVLQLGILFIPIWVYSFHNFHNSRHKHCKQAIPASCWCSEGGHFPRLLSSEYLLGHTSIHPPHHRFGNEAGFLILCKNLFSSEKLQFCASKISNALLSMAQLPQFWKQNTFAHKHACLT